MANERSFDAIGPVSFTANGGADGVVTVASVTGMRVKQQVIVASLTVPASTTEKLEIKRVLSPTKLLIGPIKTTGEFLSRANLSAYTVADMATIKVIDQKKSKPTPADIISFVYEPEGAVAIRTIGVDELGRPYSSENPVPVSATVETIQLLNREYDSGTEVYPATTQEIVTTFVGGLSGTPVQRVTLNYTSSTKENLANFQRENWNGSIWVVG